MRIKKNDTVYIRIGKDRGKTGKVFKVDTKSSLVYVEGVNLYKKHARPKREGEKGESVLLPRPLPMGKVMIYCSNCKKGVRIGSRLLKAGSKERYCKSCKVVI